MTRRWLGAALLVLAVLAVLLRCDRVDAAERAAGANVAALARSTSALYVGTFDRGVYETGSDGVAREFAPGEVDPNVNALVVDRGERHLFVGTNRGLYRCAIPRGARCARLSSNAAVHTVLELANGVVLGGGDAGLVALLPDGATRTLDRKRGAPYRSVWALAEADDGTVFIGATNGVHFAKLASWLDGTGHAGSAAPKFARASMVTGDLPDDWITALSLTRGGLRVGTYNAGVTSFRFTDGALVKEWTDTSLGYVNPAGLVALSDGLLAVATMDGLHVGAPRAWRRLPTPTRDVTALVRAGTEDREAYLVGTRRGIASVSFSRTN